MFNPDETSNQTTDVCCNVTQRIVVRRFVGNFVLLLMGLKGVVLVRAVILATGIILSGGPLANISYFRIIQLIAPLTPGGFPVSHPVIFIL